MAMAVTWHRLEARPHEPILGDDLVQRVGLREELRLAGRHDDLAGDRRAGEGGGWGEETRSEQWERRAGVKRSGCELLSVGGRAIGGARAQVGNQAAR